MESGLSFFDIRCCWAGLISIICNAYLSYVFNPGIEPSSLTLQAESFTSLEIVWMDSKGTLVKLDRERKIL